MSHNEINDLIKIPTIHSITLGHTFKLKIITVFHSNNCYIYIVKIT